MEASGLKGHHGNSLTESIRCRLDVSAPDFVPPPFPAKYRLDEVAASHGIAHGIKEQGYLFFRTYVRQVDYIFGAKLILTAIDDLGNLSSCEISPGEWLKRGKFITQPPSAPVIQSTGQSPESTTHEN